MANPVCFAAVLRIKNGSRPDLVTFPVADDAVSLQCAATTHCTISGILVIGPVGSASGAYVSYFANDVCPEQGIESLIVSTENLNAAAGLCQECVKHQAVNQEMCECVIGSR